MCKKGRGGRYSEGLPLHILDVSCLVSSGLDLRARHLLILRDNCSWESVRVQVSFTSRVHVYPPREAPRSAPESSPVHCEGRRDPQVLPQSNSNIYVCLGEKLINYQRLQAKLMFPLGSFYKGVLLNDLNHTAKKGGLKLIASVKVKQFPLNSLRILLAIHHRL